jgi:hypothetical protein
LGCSALLGVGCERWHETKR